ncbi:hypothetical protein [Chryseobacterium sp.]|uniref:hypothetical protein n=1 Tax=Chryseobacterium sp. TaxID=1871047 RepID=UPI002FC789B7
MKTRLFRNSVNTHEEIKMVFSITVDLNHNQHSNSTRDTASLEPGKSYSFFRENQTRIESSFDDIKECVTKTLTDEFPQICKIYLDADITIKCNGTYDGSLILVFTAIMNAIQIISSLKDLYDIAQLIRDLSEERVEKRLTEKYGENFSVRVLQRLPNRKCSDYRIREYKELENPIHVANKEKQTAQRDYFFWYLLISNIILFGLLVLLVFKAVIQTYG